MHSAAYCDDVLSRLLRRRQVPDEVRAVPLEPGERRRAWGVTTAGDPVVATDLGLHLPRTPRLDWADVERATWRRPVLGVSKVAQVDGAGARWQLELAEESDLADVVRSAVTASVAWTNHVRLQPAGGVRVVGRRRPGLDALEWQLVYDRDTDPTDPALVAQAEAIVEQARRAIG